MPQLQWGRGVTSASPVLSQVGAWQGPTAWAGHQAAPHEVLADQSFCSASRAESQRALQALGSCCVALWGSGNLLPFTGIKSVPLEHLALCGAESKAGPWLSCFLSAAHFLCLQTSWFESLVTIDFSSLGAKIPASHGLHAATNPHKPVL